MQAKRHKFRPRLDRHFFSHHNFVVVKFGGKKIFPHAGLRNNKWFVQSTEGWVFGFWVQWVFCTATWRRWHEREIACESFQDLQVENCSSNFCVSAVGRGSGNLFDSFSMFDRTKIYEKKTSRDFSSVIYLELFFFLSGQRHDNLFEVISSRWCATKKEEDLIADSVKLRNEWSCFVTVIEFLFHMSFFFL